MRIVHLARDEKFIPLMRDLFERAFPGANHWLIARRSRTPLKFVQPGPGVTDRAEWWFRTPLIGRDVAGADAIVAHSMTTIFANAILRAPARTRVAWLGWGYDYYPLLGSLLGPPLLPSTRALVGADDDEPATDKSQALQRVASRLQCFSVLPTEVDLLRRALPALTAPHHELPLFTAEDVFGRGGADMTGPDVLVGNSATASNNHLEAFDWLAGRTGTGRVIVPLSYGNAAYGRQVADAGRRTFGDRLDPLLDWMSIDDYNRRIAGCGFVLMNHRRQQAVGNVGAAVFRGATVILRPENPLYGFYRDLGLHLRSVGEVEAGVPLVPISDAQKADNRQRIGAHYARERVVQAIRDLPALKR